MDLFECVRLHAKISERQCKLNRNGYRSRGVDHMSHISCQGCAGLGESAQVSLPIREVTPVATNIKKYICIEEGCNKVQCRANRCTKHYREHMRRGPEERVEPCDQAGLPAEPETVREEVKEWVKESLEEMEGQPLSKPSSLAALLRTPPAPVEPEGLLIPFTREEVIALIESEVTAEDIRDLAMMLLAGELQRVAVA